MADGRPFGEFRECRFPNVTDNAPYHSAQRRPVSDQELAVEVSGQVLSQPLGEHDLVHAGAERGPVHIKCRQARPGNVRGKLYGAVVRAGEVVEGLGQPATVPLLKDCGTRDRRCFNQPTHGSNYALPSRKRQPSRR